MASRVLTERAKGPGRSPRGPRTYLSLTSSLKKRARLGYRRRPVFGSVTHGRNIHLLPGGGIRYTGKLLFMLPPLYERANIY